MDGFGRLEGREVGKVKLYTIGKMGGGVAIWRMRERRNSQQIKQTRKTHSYRQTRLAATKQCPLDNKSDVRAKKNGNITKRIKKNEMHTLNKS